MFYNIFLLIHSKPDIRNISQRCIILTHPDIFKSFYRRHVLEAEAYIFCTLRLSSKHHRVE